MKAFIINFMLYYYTTFVEEDFSIIYSKYRIFFYPAYYIKSFIKWCFSPLLIPWYLYIQSNHYKKQIEYYDIMMEMFKNLK